MCMNKELGNDPKIWHTKIIISAYYASEGIIIMVRKGYVLHAKHAHTTQKV